MALKWEDRIFQERAEAARIPCRSCGRTMWIPRSKVGQRAACSAECTEAYRAAAAAAITRPCQTCGQPFRPRPSQVRRGMGRFCSQACNTAGREALVAEETKVKAQARKREIIAAGALNYPRGEANKHWKGGLEACRQRRRSSGKEAAERRAYRKANPDKVKEFAHRRYERTMARLPAGTVERIGAAQKWKCAICRRGVRRAYHLDHITPVAKGGEHIPRNLQILCPPCNRRKQARDPIDHMQSLGWLL